MLHNTDPHVMAGLSAGARVAQLILELCSVLPVKIVNDLEQTVRCEGGWGSSGA